MNLSLMKFSVPATASTSSVFARLSKELYDPLAGVGFSDLDFETDEHISGYATKRRPIYVKVFDVDEGKVVEREEFLLSEIFFRLDITRGLAEIYAGPRDARYAVEVFEETVGSDLELTPLSESVSSVLGAMKISPEFYEITRLEINEFVAEQGAIGNYAIRSIDSDKAWKFVDKYGVQIKSACVSLVSLDFQAVVHILGSGRFRFTVRPRSSTATLAKSLKLLVGDIRRS